MKVLKLFIHVYSGFWRKAERCMEAVPPMMAHRSEDAKHHDV